MLQISPAFRSQINRRNRTRHYQWHQYSALSDCDRLWRLIALLLAEKQAGTELSPEGLALRMAAQWGACYGAMDAIAECGRVCSGERASVGV